MRSPLIPLRFQLTFGLTLLAASCLTAHAEVLADYSFTGGSLLSADSNSDSIASTFGAGAGLIPTYSEWAIVAANQTDSTSFSDDAGAYTANDYLTFTVTPTAGHALNVTSLDLSTALYSTSAVSSGSYRLYLYLRTSADGFATNVGGTVQELGLEGPTSSPSFTAQSFSELTIQNMVTPVEFRIYFADNSGKSYILGAIDSVILNGTVVTSSVPEPSTYAFLAGMIGLVFVLLTRRQTI